MAGRPLLIEIARWAIVSLFTLTLAAAAVSDALRRLIPNWAIVAIAILFVGWVFVEPLVSMRGSLEAALIVFVVSCALYAFGIVGAGDSKFITVVSLFVGLSRLPQFALATVLVGGALAVISLVTRPTRALVMLQMRGKGSFGRGIPYGVAIALAGFGTVLASMMMKSSH
jgi:prepilin peptidase CpaA